MFFVVYAKEVAFSDKETPDFYGFLSKKLAFWGICDTMRINWRYKVQHFCTEIIDLMYLEVGKGYGKEYVKFGRKYT